VLTAELAGVDGRARDVEFAPARQVDKPFAVGAVRYIKLGKGGIWAESALEKGVIPFGYRGVSHELCEQGKWEDVQRYLRENGRSVAGAGQGARELKDFYSLPDDTLWVTIADGHLWWAFASGPVKEVASWSDEEPSRQRDTRSGWSKVSLDGEPLTVRSLSSALTRTAGYRMTLCSVQREDYLLRRIQGLSEPLHAEANAAITQMRKLADRMIRQLHWEDFETLVDLIFSQSGWRRNSVLGKDQPDVDLIARQALTGETAWVQVKSSSDQAELDDYLNRFKRDGSCDRFFFVCHSPAKALALPDEPGLHLLTEDRLAKAAIDAGLFDWLAERTR